MSKTLDNFWIACDNFANRCGDKLNHFWNKFYEKANNAREKTRPVANSAYQAGIALYTFYTTAQVAITILPIVLSSVAIFSALPYFGALSSAYTYLFAGGIAALSSYFQYKDIKNREALDAQVVINRNELNDLKDQLNELKSKLTKKNTPVNSGVARLNPIIRDQSTSANQSPTHMHATTAYQLSSSPCPSQVRPSPTRKKSN